MKPRPVIPRRRAGADLVEAVEYLQGEGAESAALGLVDAVEQAFEQIGRHPELGSPRYAHELDLPGLRCWQVRRYRYLVFYVVREDHIDVWRVLHGERDLPAWLQDDDVE